MPPEFLNELYRDSSEELLNVPSNLLLIMRSDDSWRALTESKHPKDGCVFKVRDWFFTKYGINPSQSDTKYAIEALFGYRPGGG